MPSFLRKRFLFIFLICAAALPFEIEAQCVGIPPITSLGSNKFPVGLCAPVQANVTYTVAFVTPVAPGQFELVYDWGDGSSQETVALAAGSKTYHASLTHTYPAESDCEYFVTMAIRYNGKICPNTTQIQKISSWRTDAFNGGDISLISPATKTTEHLVCEGEDIAVVFQDDTNWNCNSRYTNTSGSLIESANTEYRWQQIVYNTDVAGSKIPKVQVDGVPVTDANGLDIIASYQDPRGVHYMSAPVLVDDARRRPSLKITADGGFGTAFPKAGDVFAVTVRYWNFCNPYDDPVIPGPPADILNGDHPPVEKQAVVRVLAPPPALQATDQAVCYGTTPQAFAVSGLTPGNVVNWYRYIPESDEPGALIASGKLATLPITSHPEWKNNNTPNVFKVWATQRANSSAAINCESPKILVTRIIREKLTVPAPTTTPPTEVCNGQFFTIGFPAPGAETAGGETKYVWTASSGLAHVSTSVSSASFTANVTDFSGGLYVDRTLTVTRRYADEPACETSAIYQVRIYDKPIGGSLSGGAQACEITAVGPITLTGHVGAVARWEIKKDAGAYTTYAGEAAVNSISPGILTPGDYAFRAVIFNGPCKEVYSNEKNVHVSANPPDAFAGDDQFICSALQSAALNASFSDPGNGVWSYVKSFPTGLPTPSFDPNDPNTTVVISPEHAGVYTLRWTVANGSCSSDDEVVIDFGTNPTDPDAGNDEAVCGATAVLEGNTPEKGLGSWSVVSGPDGCIGDGCPVSVLSRPSPASSVELIGPSAVYGVYTFRWTITSGGNNCFLKSDDVAITFHEPVKLSASDINGICLDDTNPQPIELTGTVSGPVFSTAWINVSGKGMVTSSSEKTSNGTLTMKALYQPSAADYASGDPVTVKLTATPLSTPCLAEEKVITINFERKPVAYAGTDIGNICNNQLQLQATEPLHEAEGHWTTTQSGVTFDDASDPKTVVRNLPLGATPLTWTVSGQGGVCSAQSSSITLTRIPLPSAIDLNISACEGEAGSTTVLLEAYANSVTTLAEADREIKWFKVDASLGETPVTNSAITQTNVPNGQVYIARIRDLRSGCSHDAKVTVTVRPLPPVMNAVISRCEDITGSHMVSGIDLTDTDFINAITRASNVNVSWYSSESDALQERFPIVTPVMANGQKEFYARVSYQDAPYCSSIARLNLVVNPQPAVTTIIGKESVCQAVSSSISNDLPVHVYQVTPVAGARYHWEIPNGPGEFQVFGGGGERDFYVLLQFPNVYRGKITVRAEVSGCSGPVIEKEIAVSAAPGKPLITGASIVCENSSYVDFHVSPDNFPSSAYNWEVRKASDNSIGGAYIMEGQLTGNVLVNFGAEDVIISVRENNAECVSPIATRVIKVANPPKANLVVQSEISCILASDGVIKTEVAGGTAPFTGFEIVQTGKQDDNNDGVFENLSHGTYAVRLKDANGCFTTSNAQVLKQPAQINPDFSITRANGACDAGEYIFTWKAEGGIDYRWEWGDGATTAIQANDIVGENRLTHTFTALSSVRPTEFPVTLFASHDGCLEEGVQKSVVLSPDINLHILAGDTVLCSGQSINFYNNSSGVETGRWYYRIAGTSALQQAEVSADKNASFTFENKTSANPLIYEVIFEAKNSLGCSAVYSKQVVVYRANRAAFELDSVPAFDTESVRVRIKNTSEVIDARQFAYTWNYGDQGTAKFPSETGPYDITYYSPGQKEITLAVLNLAAQEAGRVCRSVYREHITIPARRLHAAFTATPFASCYPVTIEVQNNSSGADTFLWKVFRAGVLVTTSNLRYPKFRIAEAGVYDIHLTASVLSTGDMDESVVKGLQVYEAPQAAFEIRADRIYVPDTEMRVFNFSNGANAYTWHFGDGTVSESFEPEHMYQNEGRYSVLLVSGLDHGKVDVDGDGVADRNLMCYDSARQEVVALQGGDLHIPNAFTPDTGGPNGGHAMSGGFNDVFLPAVKGASQFHMQIYDRWGTLVFESKDTQIGWDGYDRNQRLMPAGVYVYKIMLVQSNGETITRAGDVSLIR